MLKHFFQRNAVDEFHYEIERVRDLYPKIRDGDNIRVLNRCDQDRLLRESNGEGRVRLNNVRRNYLDRMCRFEMDVFCPVDGSHPTFTEALFEDITLIEGHAALVRSDQHHLVVGTMTAAVVEAKPAVRTLLHNPRI